MSHLELTDDQQAVAELARGIGMEALWPAARGVDAGDPVPDTLAQKLFDSGLTVPVPESLGGPGIGDAGTWLIALENLAYGDAGITLGAITTGCAAMLLARHGGADHEPLVQRLVSGFGPTAAVALYEQYGRGAAEWATSIAVADDGSARVVGTKVGVPLAASADYFVVVGVDSDTGGARAVLVRRGTVGVSVEPYGPTLALGGAACGSVTFDTVVPAGSVVGSAQEAGAILMSVGMLRLSIAAVALGVAQRSLDYAAQYATERVAFGKPIAAFQGVSFPLADARMRIDAARLEIAELAASLDAGDPDSADDVVTLISRAVAYATEVANTTTRAALQTLGGHGYITDHPVEMWFRVAATLSTLDSDPLLSRFQPVL